MQAARQLQDVGSRARRALSPGAWARISTGALIGSAVLQLVASLERWLTASNGWDRSDSTVEDHTFDYYLPADPWENLGSAGQLFGAGFLLLGVGVFAAARLTAGLGRPRGPSASRGPGATRVRGRAFDTWLAVVLAATFIVFGGHALVSGLIGAPTVLQHGYLLSILGLLQFIGLVALGIRSLPRNPLVSLACLFLLGVTTPGYLAATFVIAPELAGYQSHDTTPHTETILAVWTAAAALALFLAALRRRVHQTELTRLSDRT